MISRLLSILICFVFLTVYGTAQNYALQFNGSDERVTMRTTSSTTLSQSFTIEAWILAREWKAQSWMGSIVTNDSGTGNGGFAFRCGNDGRLSMAVSANNNWNEALSDVVMTENKWHHVATTVDQGAITLYVDGVEVALANFQGDPSASTGRITVGESTGFPGRFFDGIIDEVRIWSVARTAEEIAANTFASFNGDEPGLAAYLPMNDGSGTEVANLADSDTPATTINMDDSNWVDGFTAVEYDIAVSTIKDIDRIALKSRPIKPSVELQNIGAAPLDGMTATVMIDGEEVASESIEQTIEPGMSASYKLRTPIDLRGLDDPELSITVSHPLDDNAFNDTSTKTITSRPGLMVNIFNREQHSFGAAGQRHSETLTLPGDLSGYDEIRLRIDVRCPSTGCDPWDQPANLKIVTEQGIFELARYITPFGIACGPWYVDVTDFKSVLTGEVTFESFVQVWGQSGWLIDLDLEFVAAAQEPTYTKLSTIHALDYQVYGDPGISYDLDPVALTAADNTESSHVRMQVSGHGQGNTNNAAEFFRRNHQLQIDGNSFADHDLWKDDCNVNSCANQLGTWLFARAGWCPGQEVIPAIFNTTSEIAAGQSFDFDYELQDYTNLRNTGYNGSSHTEPHYRIHSFFVENSSTRFVDYSNLALTDINFGNDQVAAEVTNDGSVDLSNYQIRLYADGDFIEAQDIAEPITAGSTNIVTFDLDLAPQQDRVIIAEVVASEDQNAGDNLLGETYNGTVSTEEEIGNEAFSLFPNPSDGQITIRVADELIGGTWTLLTADGKQLDRQQVTDGTSTLMLEQSGLYILQLVAPSGATTSRKVIIH